MTLSPAPDEPRLSLEWRKRAEPLAPCAALGLGAAASRLLARLLLADDEQLGRLRGVGSGGLIVLLGAEADLPWVDGIRYFGRDAAAPDLLLPTRYEPTVPVPLLARAAVRRCRG